MAHSTTTRQGFLTNKQRTSNKDISSATQQSDLTLASCSFTYGAFASTAYNRIVLCEASRSLCSDFHLASIKMARFTAPFGCRPFTKSDVRWSRGYL